jgi:NAD(P)-dependent dehydrogenase (short-subunit alcohol dehydrogenase family)
VPSALIIGGGTGIGAAVALRMSAAGYDICVSGRRPAPLTEIASTVNGVAVSADATDPAGAERAVADCVNAFGRLDALVVSPGASAGGAVGEQTLERWNHVLNTNLTAPFLACRAALPHLIEAQGAIVTVSSLAGLRAGRASAAYCTSKAGLIMLTQCIARDYASTGLRANCVCPGWVRTDMGDAAMDELGAQRGVDREGAYALAAAEVPAQRAAEPEEVAEAVAWLASPAASYVNGAVLTIDGGAAVVDAGTLAFAPAGAGDSHREES